MTRCCSHAAFGPTSDPKNFPKHPLHFTATRAVDGVGCQSPPRHQGDSQEGDASHDTTAPPTASSSGGVSSSWFGWSKRRAKKDALGAPYAGHIVIADRGGCMFEEKVIQAETGGATGVIVINSEANLFMMSGIKSMDRKTDSDSNREMAGKTTIPAVMLSNPDGRYLLEAIEYLSNFEITPEIVIDLQSFPAIFDSPVMGYGYGHPSIRSSESVVHVIGQSLWSLILSKGNSNEWQLFIVPTAELQDLVPWTIATSETEDLPVSTNAAFSWSPNPAGLYHQLISEQCPVEIEWDQDVRYRPLPPT